jgi:predicted nucleic acid-binding protein
MNRKFVLDTSVLLKYTTHGKLYRLLNIVIKYKIIIYVNDNLIAELQKNLPKVIKSPAIPYTEILEDILFLTTFY